MTVDTVNLIHTESWTRYNNDPRVIVNINKMTDSGMTCIDIEHFWKQSKVFGMIVKTHLKGKVCQMKMSNKY